MGAYLSSNGVEPNTIATLSGDAEAALNYQTIPEFGTLADMVIVVVARGTLLISKISLIRK